MSRTPKPDDPAARLRQSVAIGIAACFAYALVCAMLAVLPPWLLMQIWIAEQFQPPNQMPVIGTGGLIASVLIQSIIAGVLVGVWWHRHRRPASLTAEDAD